MAHKILVIDDEENMLRLFKRVLGRQGYDVIVVESGIAGLDLADQQHFDLAIVDIGIPDKDGTIVVRDLIGRHAGLPIIAVTARPTREREQALRALGCQGFFAKPLNLKQFNDRIRLILSDK
ncbi:MAG: response regulator [Desulfobacterales bacterium]|nr:response regulator [Desulfobacterales bacterium]